MLKVIRPHYYHIITPLTTLLWIHQIVCFTDRRKGEWKKAWGVLTWSIMSRKWIFTRQPWRQPYQTFNHGCCVWCSSLLWNDSVADRLGIDKQAPQNALYMYAYTCTYERMDEHNHTHPYTNTQSCQFIRYLTNTSLKQLQQKTEKIALQASWR